MFVINLINLRNEIKKIKNLIKIGNPQKSEISVDSSKICRLNNLNGLKILKMKDKDWQKCLRNTVFECAFYLVKCSFL